MASAGQPTVRSAMAAGFGAGGGSEHHRAVEQLAGPREPWVDGEGPLQGRGGLVRLSHGLEDKAVDEVGVGSEIEQIEVLTDEDAERYQFPGSPTIRVDGVDVDPAGAAQMGTALTCRVYVLEDRRYSPVPSKEMIRRALVGESG